MPRSLLDRLKRLFRSAPIVHIKSDEITNTRDLIDLFDRFLDDRLEYELEWDDFISWKNGNSAIEEIRNRIAGLESRFFGSVQDKIFAINSLIEERNRLAIPIGLPGRRSISSLGDL